MPVYANPARFRALLAGAALLSVIAFGLLATPAPAETAGVSIVKGKRTSIKDSPWQVALAFSQRPGRKASPRARFFCGGSLITPELVITAGHCVADLNANSAQLVEVISGRTWLNDASAGQVTKVRKILMPRKPNGTRRYSSGGGGASWDVGLVRLASPIIGPTIKLAGEDEAASWAPGQVVTTTGWGITSGFARKASPVLRTANQVMLPDRVCRRYDGGGYDIRTMNCIGGPGGNTSTCSGDSGGPLVATVGTESRLVGLTSFGDAYCDARLPSVDSRISGNPMRDWIQRTALDISGVDVVGTGIVAPPARSWCSVPAVQGLTVKAARRKIEAAGCSMGSVKVDYWGSPGSRRVLQASYYPGWLVPLGTSIRLLVSR